MLGTPFEYTGEIETFLQKRPLKQAASTLYAIQKNGISKNGINVVEKIGDIGHLLEINFEWMERYYLPSLELLPPRYKDFTKKKLDSFCSQMSKDDIDKLQSLDMFPDN